MGTSFKDCNDREWTLQITAPVIDAVREVDPKFLLDDDAGEENTANRLAADPGLFCHVVYALCKRQCAEQKVTLDDFYENALGTGELIESAGAALESAITLFTPPRKRGFIKAVAAKQKAVEDLAMAKVQAKISDPMLDPKIEAALDAQIDAILARLTLPSSATSSPDGAV